MTAPRFALLAALFFLVAYVWGNSLPVAAGLIPPPWDKLGHLICYATFAGLLALGLGRQAWPWILVGTLFLAGWDEWHQLSMPRRSADFSDWLADAGGALVGIGIAWIIEVKRT